ncbi:Glia maturation factor beta [Penicillium brevicompactum]|uniref:Glia maturation factor beta n=1 Tax=Penicillium brevicompactum TaxID=5074 RepID=UPI0025409B82|nr:Glia maturation factor beta [Penicillium brevicompactum]KAJ5327463.1 Glia maturation factor beta [Penicillium brevicompactum]
MSDSRLYSFSPETKEKLRKFRLGTSRAKDAQAIICETPTPLRREECEGYAFVAALTGSVADIIDAKTQEIRPQDDEVYSKMEDLADDLPESSPRFILLSYPLTTKDGRPSVPYVLLYWLPENCNPMQRMSYANAVELMRTSAQVNRVIEVETDDDIIDIKDKLTGSD